VPGREAYNRVDAWAQDATGNLYGGVSDGYLFRLDCSRMRVDNLGKPLNQYRIRGLVIAPSGKLYGIGGDNDEIARMFSYDPSTGVYQMLGMIDVNRRYYYSWLTSLMPWRSVTTARSIWGRRSANRSCISSILISRFMGTG
jgi:hypothetical protein